MQTITTNEELLDFTASLLSSPIPLALGIDTEFVRERTYWPKLCLIQTTTSLSSESEVIFIDPLENLDLTSFQTLLAAPHITKVFHSGRQDLEICWHQWKTLPQPFFDTQLAAMVCGLGEGLGYNALVKTLFNEDIDKASQHTDWSRRPLTDKQIIYAERDVTYLLPAFEILSKKLTELNRWDWMNDDLTILLSSQTYEVDPQQAWLRLYTHRQKSSHLAVLKDICAWREINAVQLNVNRGRLLKDESILQISLTLPKTLKELQLLTDSPTLTEALAEDLFTIYLNALECPKELWPEAPLKKVVLSPQTRQKLKILQEKLNEVAEKLNIPIRLIARKNDLMAFAKGQKEDSRLLTGWRYDIFGHMIENIFDK